MEGPFCPLNSSRHKERDGVSFMIPLINTFLILITKEINLIESIFREKNPENWICELLRNHHTFGYTKTLEVDKLHNGFSNETSLPRYAVFFFVNFLHSGDTVTQT